jgi:hypothetical protein
MRALDRWIAGACDRLDGRSLPAAIALLGVSCLLANMAVAFGVVLPLKAAGAELALPSAHGLVARGFPFAFAVAVVAMPLFETWLLQVVPFFVLRHWTGRPAILVPCTAVVFAGAHAIGSLGHAIAQLGGGLVLAFTFFWASRRPPKPSPVLATWAVHALNNLVAVGALFLVLQLTPR